VECPNHENGPTSRERRNTVGKGPIRVFLMAEKHENRTINWGGKIVLAQEFASDTCDRYIAQSL
jgi:hypothetical protein